MLPGECLAGAVSRNLESQSAGGFLRGSPAVEESDPESLSPLGPLGEGGNYRHESYYAI